MPYHTYRFDRSDLLEFEDDIKGLLVDTNVIRLRRLNNSQDAYDAYGKFYETTVVLPNFKASGLTALYAFYPVELTWGGSANTRLAPPIGFGVGVGALRQGAYYLEPVTYPTGLGAGLKPTGPDPLYPGITGYGYQYSGRQVPPTGYGGQLTYRASPDDGSTWWVWTGAVWEEAVGPLATTWNTALELDAGFPDFPLDKDEPQVRIKVRMTPSADGEQTPVLAGLVLYVDFDYDMEDDVMRSMRRYLEDSVSIRTTWKGNVSNATTFQVEHYWRQMAGPVEVYNLTTDPNRTTNLFSSLTADNKGLVLTSAQSGLLEATLRGCPEVYITAEEVFQLSHTPAVVIFSPRLVERRDLRVGDLSVEISYGREEARGVYSRTFHEATFRITTQSSLHHESIRLADALQRALTQYRNLPSLAIGDLLWIVGATPVDDMNRVGSALFARAFSCVVVTKGFLRPDFVVDLPLVKELNIVVRPVNASRRGLAWLEDP